MATEILRPQDCLIGSHNGYPRTKSIHRGGVGNPRINRKGKVAQSSQMTILRRGESLDGRSKMGANRVGRNPSDLYAGSDFLSTSPPPPSSLPLPSFWTKKSSSVGGVDSASRDLRRLLRLE